MSDTQLEMMPYLFYRGNCEEALHFYRDILDGRIEIVSRYDNPAMNMPEDFKDKILHASFHFGNYTLFASDVMPKNKDDQMTSNIAISLAFHDEETARTIFEHLSSKGEVHIPFKKQFWGDWHGNFKDRFGIRWMVNCSK